MIRIITTLLILVSLTGCLAAIGPGSSSNATQFADGLGNLEQSGDTALLKSLANEKSSGWSSYSSAVLNIYAGQQKKIQSLKKQNDTLEQENKKLQENLDKLNQINIELEKRRN